MVSTAVGRNEVTAQDAIVRSSLPVSENAVNTGEQLPDLSLCNIQLQHTVNSLPSKRVQGDKELLLLHADKISNAVKAGSGDHIKFADSLTHVFLFLFPNHFFW